MINLIDCQILMHAPGMNNALASDTSDTNVVDRVGCRINDIDGCNVESDDAFVKN